MTLAKHVLLKEINSLLNLFATTKYVCNVLKTYINKDNIIYVQFVDNTVGIKNQQMMKIETYL